MTTLEEILEHHGVKGMRWGTRRKRGKDGRVKGDVKKDAEKGSAAKTKFSKPPSRLSDADLNKRIKRLEMEKRYNELNADPPSEGRTMTTRILKNVGEQTATRALNDVAFYAVKQAVGRRVGADVAKEIFGKKK